MDHLLGHRRPPGELLHLPLHGLRSRRRGKGGILCRALAVAFVVLAALAAFFAGPAQAGPPVNVDEDAWTTNGPVSAIALDPSTGTVYIGGSFSELRSRRGTPASVARNNIASLDATGAPTSWNPNADAEVYALAISGKVVYAGGQFFRMGGQSGRLAAVDASTGSSTLWFAGWGGGGIRALAISGNTVYVGGSLEPRGYAAPFNLFSLDTTTGRPTFWGDPPWVFALAVSAGTVYAAGDFTSIVGETTEYVAAFDATTGAATDWNARANNWASALAVSGDTVYVGGAFTNIGRQTRNGLAALNAVTGTARDWNPDGFGGDVRAIVAGRGRVYVGGGFGFAILNQPPAVSDIPELTVPEDAILGPVSFTVGDFESGASGLTLTAASSNPSLVPVEKIVFGGSVAARTLTVTPVPDQYGSAAITVRVSDGRLSASDSFTLTVLPVNDPPSLDAIADITIDEDAAEQTTGLSGISPGPPNESGQALAVTALSSRLDLVPNPAVTYASPGATGSLRFTPVPDANGVATITVTVRDDGGTANGGVDMVTRTFKATVNPVNDPPTLDAIADRTIDEDTWQVVALSGMSQGPANESAQVLTLTATSSNPSLLPNPTVYYGSPNGIPSYQPRGQCHRDSDRYRHREGRRRHRQGWSGYCHPHVRGDGQPGQRPAYPRRHPQPHHKAQCRGADG